MRICLELPNSLSIFWQCLYDWQTLVSGILALIAAVISVIFIIKQIGQAEKHHQAELQRRHNAVRAIMPLALSSINTWNQHILNNCCQVKNEPVDQQFDVHQQNFELNGGEGILTYRFFGVEAVSSDTLNTLKDFVETLSCQDIIKITAKMVSCMQDLTSDISARRYQDDEGYYSGLTAFSSHAEEIGKLHDTISDYCRNFDLQILNAGHKN